MAQHAVHASRTTIRHACSTFGISETCYRATATRAPENAIIADWLLRLTTASRTWGFGLCYLYLQNVTHFAWHHKRVYRIYRDLERNLRITPRRRLVREIPQPLAVPTAINQMWSMDFMHDQLRDGRRRYAATTGPNTSVTRCSTGRSDAAFSSQSFNPGSPNKTRMSNA